MNHRGAAKKKKKKSRIDHVRIYITYEILQNQLMNNCYGDKAISGLEFKMYDTY